MNKPSKAILYILLSALAFSSMQVFVKLSGSEIPLFEKIFMRNLLIIFGVLLILRKNKTPIKIPKKLRFPLLMRCISGYTGVTCFFYATQNMRLGDATAIHQSSPIFVVLLSALILNEKITKEKLLVVLFGFTGVLLIVKPSFSASAFPSLVALTGALGAALAYISISYIGKDLQGELIILFFAIFSSVASLPFLIGNFVIPKGIVLLYLLAIGLFGGLGQYFVTHGYKLAKAGDISIYSYSGIIFSGLFGILIFRESPDYLSFIGMAIILVAGYLLFKLTQNKNSLNEK